MNLTIDTCQYKVGTEAESGPACWITYRES